MKSKFNFTTATLDNLPLPSKDIKKMAFRDMNQRGLVLIIGYGGAKAFYFRGKLNRKKVMFKIGEYPYMSIEDARERAFLLNKDIKNGILPSNATSNQSVVATLSLNDFFHDEYIPKYAKIFKKQDTWQENERMFKARFSSLKDCPVNQITRLNVDTWHKDIGSNGGIYMANRCLALLRHMLNMAVDWGLISSNPAAHIRMYKETARDRFLQPSEISRFMEALIASTNEKLKHFILLLLFLGQRKGNILSLRWEYFNFHNNILYLPDTKNNQAQQIPLTEQAIAVLKEIGIRESGWVFPSDNSASGHLESPKRFWAELLEQAGIENLRMHDLRRTMGSYQAIIGSSMNVIGKSLGHKSLQSTAIYARLSLDPVRASMQKATNEIMKNFF